MLSTCSSVPFHPFGVLPAARHPRGHSALPGYSAPSWLLGAFRCPPSHSAISCLPNPPCVSEPPVALMVTSRSPALFVSILLAGMYEAHTSLIGALLAARRNPGHWLPRVPPCIPTATRRLTNHSARSFALVRVCLTTRYPSSTRCPLGALQTKKAPSVKLLSVSASSGSVFRR